MDQDEGLTDPRIPQRTQPPRLRGGVRSIQERMAWMTRISARRVMTVSPPGRKFRASAAMKRSVLGIHSNSGERHASTVIIRGSSATRLPCRRVIEAYRAADEPWPRPRRRMRIISYRSLACTRGSRKADTGDARFAGQPVPFAMGHEPQVTRLQEAGFFALDLQPAPAVGHDVEHQGLRASPAAPAPTAR